MNINNSISETIQAINKFEPDPEIFRIIKDVFAVLSDYLQEAKNAKDVAVCLDQLRDKFERASLNLYPASEEGICHPFCLGIAAKSFEAKRTGLVTGFKGLMVDMVAYWFSCLARNKTTLILTSDWNNMQFEELYLKIIDNYSKCNNKNIFIVEVSTAGLILRYSELFKSTQHD